MSYNNVVLGRFRCDLDFLCGIYVSAIIFESSY